MFRAIYFVAVEPARTFTRHSEFATSTKLGFLHRSFLFDHCVSRYTVHNSRDNNIDHVSRASKITSKFNKRFMPVSFVYNTGVERDNTRSFFLFARNNLHHYRRTGLSFDSISFVSARKLCAGVGRSEKRRLFVVPFYRCRKTKRNAHVLPLM